MRRPLCGEKYHRIYGHHSVTQKMKWCGPNDLFVSTDLIPRPESERHIRMMGCRGFSRLQCGVNMPFERSEASRNRDSALRSWPLIQHVMLEDEHSVKKGFLELSDWIT